MYVIFILFLLKIRLGLKVFCRHCKFHTSFRNNYEPDWSGIDESDADMDYSDVKMIILICKDPLIAMMTVVKIEFWQKLHSRQVVTTEGNEKKIYA